MTNSNDTTTEPTVYDLATRMGFLYISARHAKSINGPYCGAHWFSNYGDHSITATDRGVSRFDGWKHTDLNEDPAGTTFAALVEFMAGDYKRKHIEVNDLPEPVVRAMIVAILNERSMPGTAFGWATSPATASVI